MPNSSNGNIAGFRLDPKIHDVKDVLKIQTAALQSWMDGGKSIVEFEGNGTSVKETFTASPGEILAECRRYLKAYDPCTFGATVRQTRMIRIA